MNLTVQRRWLTLNSTQGELSIAGDDRFKLYTLEPVTRADTVKPRAIPAGTYPLTIRYSPKHGRLIPHVEDVPGFEEIEIHIGNFPKDTIGCTVVGRTRQADAVLQSHAAFDDLFGRLFAAAAENTGGKPDEHVIYHVGFITFVDAGKESA
jgi:Family of unknown function (DUF5675)